jgi:hypothetical protein
MCFNNLRRRRGRRQSDEREGAAQWAHIREEAARIHTLQGRERDAVIRALLNSEYRAPTGRTAVARSISQTNVPTLRFSTYPSQVESDTYDAQRAREDAAFRVRNAVRPWINRGDPRIRGMADGGDPDSPDPSGHGRSHLARKRQAAVVGQNPGQERAGRL